MMQPADSIYALPISERTKNALINNGLQTIDEVVDSMYKLPYMRGIGRKALLELKEAISALGGLRSSVPNVRVSLLDRIVELEQRLERVEQSLGFFTP